MAKSIARVNGNTILYHYLQKSLQEEDERLFQEIVATYSFMPNLVWLPSNLAKLTDRDESFTQLFMQALSYKIYHDVEVDKALKQFTDDAWSRLPRPDFSGLGLPDVKELNFFRVPQSFFGRRVDKISTASKALLSVATGDSTSIKGKILHTRYTAGLKASPPVVSASAAKELGDHLAHYGETVLPILSGR